MAKVKEESSDRTSFGTKQGYIAFFKNSIDAILVATPEGRVLAANPSACEMFGMTEQEVIERGRSGLVDMSDPVLLQLLAEREKTGSFRGELRFIRKDGTVFTAEISSALFDEADGRKLTIMIIRDISLRKKLEGEIRNSEEQYRRLFMDNPQPMCIYDLDNLRFLEVNDAAIKHYGYSGDEFRSMTIKEIRPKEDIALLLKDVELARENRSSESEWRHIKKNGEEITVEIIAHSLSYKGRKARHIMINDVTYRRQMEKTIRESELRFRKIYEAGPYGMVLSGPDQKFIMANETFCRISGYSESELKRLSFIDITYGEDVVDGKEAYRKLTGGEIQVYKTEKRYVRKDGTILWGLLTVTPNFDDHGNYAYSVGIIEDITDRKNAEENIKLLNIRLTHLVEVIQRLSMANSLEAIVNIVRTTIRDLLNADGAAFILREGDMARFVDVESVKPLRKGMLIPLTNCGGGWAILNKQILVIDDIYKDPRVKTREYGPPSVKSVAIAPIRINEPLGAIGAYWKEAHSPSEAEIQLLQTLADATAKAVENLQLIEGLEQKINERTAELQSLNRELESFSYSVSHDLRAPLRHINGFAGLLAGKYSGNLPEEAARYLDTIVSSAEKMGVLIDDLLTLSRTGRAELKLTQVSMKRVVSEVRDSLEQDTAGRNIEWQIMDLPDCRGDENLVRQAWINLAGNAVKYTRTREKAKITIGHLSDNGESVYYISDNGVGFDMRYAQKLFGVFQRLHSSTEFEGTGIGLANVQRIISRHGGRIWAHAEPDNGASFYFTVGT